MKLFGKRMSLLMVALAIVLGSIVAMKSIRPGGGRASQRKSVCDVMRYLKRDAGGCLGAGRVAVVDWVPWSS